MTVAVSFFEMAAARVKGLWGRNVDVTAEAAFAQAALVELADGALGIEDIDLSHIFDDCVDLQDAMGGIDLPPAPIAVAPVRPSEDDSNLQVALGGSKLLPAPAHAADAARIAVDRRLNVDLSDLQEVLA